MVHGGSVLKMGDCTKITIQPAAATTAEEEEM